MIRRFLVICLVAFWVGGFTFYTGVAIPEASEVLGGHREAGFITQRVTQWLNLAGVVTLAALAWNVAAGWRVAAKCERGWLGGTLAFMIATEIALLVLHPLLDGKLDSSARQILRGTNFDSWHRAYLWISTAQWFAAVAHIWFMLAVWRHEEATK